MGRNRDQTFSTKHLVEPGIRWPRRAHAVHFMGERSGGVGSGHIESMYTAPEAFLFDIGGQWKRLALRVHYLMGGHTFRGCERFTANPTAPGRPGADHGNQGQ